MKDNNFYYIQGKPLPRVSKILNIIAKPGLMYWYGKVGIDEANRIKEESATFGTGIHNILERIGKGETFDLSELQDNQKRCIESFLNWKQENNIEFVKAEMTVYNDEYAGTLDAVVKMGDSLCLIDYKVTNRFYSTFDVQVAAYLKAYEKMTKEKIDKVYILRFERDLGKEKAFEIKEVTNINYLYKIFLHALALYKWFYKEEVNNDGRS